jgi:hypothetical protein
MSDTPILLPQPRSLSASKETVPLPDKRLIVIPNASLLFEAQQAQAALAAAGLKWEIVAGAPQVQYADAGIVLTTDADLEANDANHFSHAQGYRLTITPTEIRIHGADAAGVFYGVCTLRQLLQQYGKSIPGLSIEDWPDYPARGVMLDISRDKVPTLETTLALIDRLADWKINQVQLYMEHTFAYRNHPEAGAKASPFTGEEILKLDAFCRQRHVELVPNQNSLGHTERWLKHERYAPLAEMPEGYDAPWGQHIAPSTLNPLDPGSIEFMFSLYDELLPHFTSRLFNIGGDEPWELGKGRSKAEAEARGTGRVYLDYILKLYEGVRARDHRMQFWADIILKYPELVPELPKDVTVMMWAYEGGEAAWRDWEKQCETVAQSGVPFYVCPGTSSWNSLAGRTDNMMDNCNLTAELGLKHGAVGYLNTDWGDGGHWQPLPVSYAGFAYGAAVSWCYQANKGLDLARALDAFAFEDSAGVMGRLAVELGNIYQMIGPEHINGQILFYTLQVPQERLERNIAGFERWGEGKADVSPETLREVLSGIEAITQSLGEAKMARPDAPLIKDEFRQVANLLRHSAQRLLLWKGERNLSPSQLYDDLETLVERQRAIWLGRNRPGGLEDSLARFDVLLKEYRQLAQAAASAESDRRKN